MGHYVIGDVHGCTAGLEALLTKLAPSSEDKLTFIGDLVGKGPDDWGVLRMVRGLSNVQIVLGNWDLFFLKQHYEAMSAHRLNDEQMYCYSMLQHASLAKWHMQTDSLLVHAGVWPGWSVREVLSLASEVEAVLKDMDLLKGFMRHFYGDEGSWQPDMSGWKRVRCLINIFTRIRMLNQDMQMCFNYTGPADYGVNVYGDDSGTPQQLTPWYLWQKQWPCRQIIFGHWAMLKGETGCRDIINIDGGYIYGGSLIAVNCETKERIIVKNPG